MPLPITSLYTIPIAVLLVALSVAVSTQRGRHHVALGDGGNAVLTVWIRRHGNLVETAPFTLFVMALAEAGGAGGGLLHASGLILLAARLIHPFGITVARPDHPLRVLGGVGTSIATLIPAVSLAMQRLV